MQFPSMTDLEVVVRPLARIQGWEGWKGIKTQGEKNGFDNTAWTSLMAVCDYMVNFTHLPLVAVSRYVKYIRLSLESNYLNNSSWINFIYCNFRSLEQSTWIIQLLIFIYDLGKKKDFLLFEVTVLKKVYLEEGIPKCVNIFAKI